MNPTFLLMRHGDAEPLHSADRDFDRPLTARGYRDIEHIGRWIQKYGWIADRIICSTAQRAKQTSEYLCQQIGINPQTIESEERIYEADLNQLIAILNETSPSTKKLMIVGHNPGLSHLLNYLLPDESANSSMPTAALAIISLDASWRNLDQNIGKLLSLILPQNLTN
jgi:phosphohistidine phosphatase